MSQKVIIHSKFDAIKDDINKAISNFEDHNEILGKAERNVIKNVEIEGALYTIKSFKVPNIINQVVYRFFRKSKAERSYKYANNLINLGIGTPHPVAYSTQNVSFLFKKSFYISEFLDCDLTYRELTLDFNIKDHEAILRAFTRFTYKLHEKDVHFLDHSPGNTLINRIDNTYEFYLVDLNRMEFGVMDFETRMKNFARLTIHKSMIEVMSNEYAKCSGENESKIFNSIWQYTKAFQHRFYRKKRIKKRLFFWKKKYKNKTFNSPI